MVKAKKRFGQNFLHDKGVLAKIIQAIPKGVENIVEIGPGLGDLTQELLKISQVKAYEIDSELIALLKKKFEKDLKTRRLELIHQDIAKVKKLDDKKHFLVANLPYYIASRIILNALEDENCLGLLVMVQKEMAEKFCAEVKDRNFSALAVLSQMLCERKILFYLEPSYFNPPPKVSSALMLLLKKQDKILIDLKEFQAFLGLCFKSRRRQLKTNLKNHQKEVDLFIKEFALKESIRAHEICVDLYLKLYKKIKEQA